jgi:hypothetical protein
MLSHLMSASPLSFEVKFLREGSAAQSSAYIKS